MKNLKLFCVAVVATVVVAVAASSGQADTSGPFTTSTPIPVTLTDWTGSLAFPQFNPALGTLESVELDLSSGLTTTLTVQNNAESGSTGTVKTELQVTVQDGGNNLNAPELDLLSPSFGYSLNAGQGITSGLLTENGSDDEVYTSAPVLSEFTGGGTITLPASTFTQTLLANTGGNTNAQQVTDADLTGTVTYTYTPVPTPEPSTLVLLGAAAVGLLGYPWRRRISAA